MGMTPDDSTLRMTVAGVEFSIWYEGDSQYLWISSRPVGAPAWGPGVNVLAYDGNITTAGGADAFVAAKVLPVFESFILSKIGGATVPQPPSETFPEPVAAVLALVRRFVFDAASRKLTIV